MRLVAGFLLLLLLFMGKLALQEKLTCMDRSPFFRKLEQVLRLRVCFCWCDWRRPSIDRFCCASARSGIFVRIFNFFFFFCACVCFVFPCCFSFVFLFKTNSPNGEGKTNMFVFPLVLPELWIHIDVLVVFFILLIFYHF